MSGLRWSLAELQLLLHCHADAYGVGALLPERSAGAILRYRRALHDWHILGNGPECKLPPDFQDYLAHDAYPWRCYVCDKHIRRAAP